MLHAHVPVVITSGLKGGSIRLSATSAHCVGAKNACAFTDAHMGRAAGSFCSSYHNKKKTHISVSVRVMSMCLCAPMVMRVFVRVYACLIKNTHGKETTVHVDNIINLL